MILRSSIARPIPVEVVSGPRLAAARSRTFLRSHLPLTTMRPLHQPLPRWTPRLYSLQATLTRVPTRRGRLTWKLTTCRHHLNYHIIPHRYQPVGVHPQLPLTRLITMIVCLLRMSTTRTPKTPTY